MDDDSKYLCHVFLDLKDTDDFIESILIYSDFFLNFFIQAVTYKICL